MVQIEKVRKAALRNVDHSFRRILSVRICVSYFTPFETLARSACVAFFLFLFAVVESSSHLLQRRSKYL